MIILFGRMEDPPPLEPEQGYLKPSAFFAETTQILWVPCQPVSGVYRQLIGQKTNSLNVNSPPSCQVKLDRKIMFRKYISPEGLVQFLADKFIASVTK